MSNIGASAEKYGDFCGFSFNGYHSSEMGFIRVSESNRYTDNLIPTFQDKTVPIPGGDGTYFFESFYTQKAFQIKIAFDSMTEEQMRQMRQVFSTKNMGDLIFDEVPYKAYTAKVQSQPQLKYICFDSASGRVYKGEGTIQFVAYNPYARSVHKYLNLYNDSDYPNKGQWKGSSGMKDTQGTLDGTGMTVNLYNAGDISTDFKAFYSFSGNTSLSLSGIQLYSDGTLLNELHFATPISKIGTDSYLRINSKTNLLEGCDSQFKPTGNLYNKYVTTGEFFKIPVSTTSSSIYQFITTPSSLSCAKIDYDYLYY